MQLCLIKQPASLPASTPVLQPLLLPVLPGGQRESLLNPTRFGSRVSTFQGDPVCGLQATEALNFILLEEFRERVLLSS